jgi:predicted ATP-dependent endonuclease of OLD family
LQADPIFADAQVAGLVEIEDSQVARQAGQIFRKLSSGHKIVLLTITKLVEKVEEKTLVLMDEPEAHLHPPLLSAFVRALSDLLINRNGVAIIATHSPVVLQEVPASCVWKIVRQGLAARADRPEIETFAENVGVLTREVFGLEVTRSGFHKMIADAIGDLNSIDEVLGKFDNEVGSDGRALISSLIAARSADEGE